MSESESDALPLGDTPIKVRVKFPHTEVVTHIRSNNHSSLAIPQYQLSLYYHIQNFFTTNLLIFLFSMDFLFIFVYHNYIVKFIRWYFREVNMSKTLKVLLICIILILALGLNFSYATSTNDTDTNETTNTVKEDSDSKSSLSTLSPTSSSSVTGVSGMNSYSQANLELNNILCIILIAIGILIILLSIAILIRLKK